MGGCLPCSPSLGQPLAGKSQVPPHGDKSPQPHLAWVSQGDTAGTQHPPGTTSGASTPRATCVGNGWVAMGPAPLQSSCPALVRAQKDRDRVGYQKILYIGGRQMGRGRRTAGAKHGPGQILAQSVEQSAQHSLSVEGCRLLRPHVWRDQLRGAYSHHQPPGWRVLPWTLLWGTPPSILEWPKGM